MAINNAIKYASDNDILNACADGAIGWGYTETVELSKPESELSDEARKARALIHLMLKLGMDQWSAEEEYKRLLPDSERRIPFLAERIEELHEKRLIIDDELGEYRETNEASHKIRALLFGLEPKEAARFARLAGLDHKERTQHQEINWLLLHGKMNGLTEDEAAEYATTLNSPNGAREYLKNRMRGFTPDMAQRFEELVDKARSGEITREEDHERKALIHLRSVLTRADFDIEKRLALMEFGVDRMLEYILLQPSINPAVTANKFFRSMSGNISNPAMAQNLLYLELSRNEPPVQNEQRSEEIRSDLQKEPLLRQFIHDFRDALLSHLC